MERLCAHGQGATEYLVLLAVVLIVALVSVALLGFFPGMASDAQITQSQAYWAAASPIAAIEFGTAYNCHSQCSPDQTVINIRVRNTGGYPIRITKLWSDGVAVTRFYNGNSPIDISASTYIAPGAESCFGNNVGMAAAGCTSAAGDRSLSFLPLPYAGGSSWIGAATSVCSSSGGTFQIKNFGFEYIEYIEGQQITKKQMGKPLIVKCGGTI